MTIRLARGQVMEGGYLRPGEEAPCPERTPAEYATKFFADLCRNRSEFGTWTGRPTYRLESGPTVAYAIGGYGVEIHYRNGQVKLDGEEPVFSREATKVVAKETAAIEDASTARKAKG